MIVADTDTMNTSPTARNPVVADSAAALAGKRALIAYIPSGNSLGSFALQTGGHYLLRQATARLRFQVVNLSDLP